MILFILYMCYVFFFLMIRRPPRSTRTDTLFPYTTLFRSVDLGRQRCRVREFERDVSFPAGFERGHVDDDPAARIGRFAEADHEHVVGHAELFDRAGEREAVGGDDAHVGLALDRSEESRVGKEGVRTGRYGWWPDT